MGHNTVQLGHITVPLGHITEQLGHNTVQLGHNTVIIHKTQLLHDINNKKFNCVFKKNKEIIKFLIFQYENAFYRPSVNF